MWIDWLQFALSTISLERRKGRQKEEEVGDVVPRRQLLPRLTGFRLGFRNQFGQHEREEREALGPSRSRVEFPQKWPVGREKTAWWQ